MASLPRMERAERTWNGASVGDGAWRLLRLLRPIRKLVKGVLSRRGQLVSGGGKEETAAGPVLAPATVLQPDGEAVDYRGRTRCCHAMRQYPSYRLCPTSALVLRQESYLLADDEWLQPGEIYILVPRGKGILEPDAKIPISIKNYSTIVARFNPESIHVRVGSGPVSYRHEQMQLTPTQVTREGTDWKRGRSVHKATMPRISE